LLINCEPAVSRLFDQLGLSPCRDAQARHEPLAGTMARNREVSPLLRPRFQRLIPQLPELRNHLLLATSVSGTRVFGMLDTGANDTDLNENFSEQFPALLQSGTRETREITGAGGTASVASITVAEVPFHIGPTRVVLRPAHGTLQRTVASGGACCIGNIGRDVLAQTGDFVLDLLAMVLQLR
jgi:hypothetical protein